MIFNIGDEEGILLEHTERFLVDERKFKPLELALNCRNPFRSVE